MNEERAAARIGDRDRRAVDERLQRAHGDGVLTLAEYEERGRGVLGGADPFRPRRPRP